MLRSSLSLFSAAVLSVLVSRLDAVGTDKRGGVQDFAFIDDAPPLMIRVRVEIDGQPLYRRWNDCVTRIFKHLDKNGDGFLDAKEAEQVPSAHLFFPSTDDPIRRYFGPPGTDPVRIPNLANLDTNGDGKVSREELANYYRKNGGADFQFVGDRAFNGPSYFATVRVSGTQGPPADVNEALFRLLDTNKDGKLSRDELAAGAKRLAKLDLDEDEMISSEEIHPTGRRVNLNAYYAVQSLPRSDDRLVLLSAGEFPMTLAQRLMKRYSKDKIGDNLLSFLGAKLSAKEIGLDAAAFAILDVNKDGFLDANELKHFGKIAPHLELSLKLSKNAALERLPVKGTLALKDAGNGLILDRGPSRVVFRLDPGTLRGDVKNRLKSEFQIFDQDGNGYIDRREARDSIFYSSLFHLMDADKDGKVFEKEMLAYIDSWGELLALSRSSCVTLTLAEEGKGIFDFLDTNRDRRLSVREIRQLPKLLDLLDRNKDGFLEPSEFPRSSLLEFRHGPAGRERSIVDVNTLDELLVPAPAMPQAKGPLWFRKMDRNRDGDVSRAEFLGTDDEFRRIDTDGDGLISLEEAERFDALMRKKK
jgi:Ca2+-binding EF-hand superfamily protein